MDPGETTAEDERLLGHVGPVEIDWPLALGYYGGIGLAVALEMLEPPLAIFIAAVPLFKMINRPNSTLAARILAKILAGAAKPVGGDGEAAVRVDPATALPGWGLGGIGARARAETRSVWAEAQRLRRGA